MIAYGISYLLSKSKPSPEKLSTYECGEEPEGSARIQFNSRFYVIALVFLLFDVEIVFLFPWSAVFARDAIMEQVPVWGWLSFTEMIIFVCILLVGLVYVWMKGDLAWIRPRQLIPLTGTNVPATLYAAINEEKFVVREFSMPDKTETTLAATTPGKPAAASGATAVKPAAPPAAVRRPPAGLQTRVRQASRPAAEQQQAAKPKAAPEQSPGRDATPAEEKPAPPKPAFKPRIAKKGN